MVDVFTIDIELPLDKVIHIFTRAKRWMICIASTGILSVAFALVMMAIWLFSPSAQASILFVASYIGALLMAFALAISFFKVSIEYSLLHRCIAWRISKCGKLPYESLLVELDIAGVSMHINRQTYESYLRMWKDSK